MTSVPSEAPSASSQAKGPLNVLFLVDTRPPPGLTPALVLDAAGSLHGSLSQILLYFQVCVNSRFEWAYSFYDSCTRGSSLPTRRKLQPLSQTSIMSCVDEYRNILMGYVTSPHSRQKYGSPLYNTQRELMNTLADFGLTNYAGMNRKKGPRHTWLQSHFAPVPIKNYLYMVSPMPHSWSEMVEFQCGSPSNRGDYFFNDVQVMDVLNPVREAFFSKGLWDGFVDHCLSWNWIDTNPDPLVEFPRGRGTYPGMNRVVMENIVAAYGGHIIPHHLVSSSLAYKDVFSFSTLFNSYRSIEISPGLGISLCNSGWRPGYEYAISMVPDRSDAYKLVLHWSGNLKAANDISKVICRMDVMGHPSHIARPVLDQCREQEDEGNDETTGNDTGFDMADEFMSMLGTINSIELVQRFSRRRVAARLSSLQTAGYLFCVPTAEGCCQEEMSRINIEDGPGSSARTLLDSLVKKSQVLELRISFSGDSTQRDTSDSIFEDVRPGTGIGGQDFMTRTSDTTSHQLTLQAILYGASFGLGVIQVLKTQLNFHGTKPLRHVKESPVPVLPRALKASTVQAPTVDLLKRSNTTQNLNKLQRSSDLSSYPLNRGRGAISNTEVPKHTTSTQHRNTLKHTTSAPDVSLGLKSSQDYNGLGNSVSSSISATKHASIPMSLSTMGLPPQTQGSLYQAREFCISMLDPAFIDFDIFVESAQEKNDVVPKATKDLCVLEEFAAEVKDMTAPWEQDDNGGTDDDESEDDHDGIEDVEGGDDGQHAFMKTVPGGKVDAQFHFKPQELPESIDGVCMGFRKAYLDHLYNDEYSVLDYVHRLNAACKKITALAAKESILLKDAMQQLVSFVIEFVRIWPDMLEAKYYQLSKDIGIEIRYRLTFPDRYVVQQDERNDLDTWMNTVKKCIKDTDIKRYRDKLEKKDTQIQIVQNLHILMLVEKYGLHENKPFKNDPGALESARSLMETLGIKALGEEDDLPTPFQSPRTHDTMDMNSAKRFHKNIIERFYSPSLPKLCRHLARACGLDDRFMRSPRPIRRPNATLFDRMTKPRKIDLVAIKAEKDAEEIKKNPILKILKSSVFRNREVTMPAGVIKGNLPSTRKKKSTKTDANPSTNTHGLERTVSSSTIVPEDEVEEVPRFAKVRRRAQVVQTVQDYSHMGDLAHLLPLKGPSDLLLPKTVDSSLVPLSPAAPTPQRTAVSDAYKRPRDMSNLLKSPKKRRSSISQRSGLDILKSPRKQTAYSSGARERTLFAVTPTRRSRGSGGIDAGWKSPSANSLGSARLTRGPDAGVVPETPVANQGRVLYYEYGLTTDELHGMPESHSHQPRTPTRRTPSRHSRTQNRASSPSFGDDNEEGRGHRSPPPSPSLSLWAYASQFRKNKG